MRLGNTTDREQTMLYDILFTLESLAVAVQPYADANTRSVLHGGVPYAVSMHLLRVEDELLSRMNYLVCQQSSPCLCPRTLSALNPQASINTGLASQQT